MITTDQKVTVIELSKLAGCQKRWIYELIEQDFIPKPIEDVVSLSESIQGIVRFYSRKKEPSRERFNRAQANREERKDKMEAGETVSISTVLKKWEDVLLIFRERVMRIPNNMQSKCGLTEPQRKSAEQEVSDALNELKKKVIYEAEKSDEEEAKQPESK